MTGLGAIFGLPILMFVTLWVLAFANTYTVVFRIQKVRPPGAGAGRGCRSTPGLIPVEPDALIAVRSRHG